MGRAKDNGMKPHCSKQKNHALTLVELLALIVTIAILAATLLPANGGKRKAIIINCANNLKQVGFAYKVWSNDHNDKYPMDVSVTNGGTMELMNTADAWKTFQVMSNELSTPKVIFCPGDSSRDNYTYATTFGEDLKKKSVTSSDEIQCARTGCRFFPAMIIFRPTRPPSNLES
jgi:competence protein ComGC